MNTKCGGFHRLVSFLQSLRRLNSRLSRAVPPPRQLEFLTYESNESPVDRGI